MSLSNAELYRLKSDARRGLLENDLILQRFFERYGAQLNEDEGKVLTIISNTSAKIQVVCNDGVWGFFNRSTQSYNQPS